jgi:hypothetical protein
VGSADAGARGRLTKKVGADDLLSHGLLADIATPVGAVRVEGAAAS